MSKSFAFVGSAVVLAGSLGASALATGCGGSQQVSAAAEPQQGLQAAGRACSGYAKRLCEELGPRSESCRSVLGVVPLLPASACEAGMEEFGVTEKRVAQLRGLCDAVSQAVCERFGEDSESCVAIRSDLPEIPPGHCASLLRDKDQLLAALEQRELLSAPLSEGLWSELTGGSPPSFGATDAKVVIVEFSDFQCPFCAQAASTMEQVKEAYGERVRVVFRQYPLPFHPHAHGAAQAALAAHEQGKFWAYHDLLFDNQEALEQESLLAYAQKLGLDMEAFGAASTGEGTAGRVAADLALGERVNVRGTPTMFVNRKRVGNPIDFDEVSAAIDEALESVESAETTPAPAKAPAAPATETPTEEPAASARDAKQVPAKSAEAEAADAQQASPTPAPEKPAIEPPAPHH